MNPHRKAASAAAESPAASRQRWLANLRRQRQAGILDPELADLIPHLECVERGIAVAPLQPGAPLLSTEGGILDPADAEAREAALSLEGSDENVRASLQAWICVKAEEERLCTGRISRHARLLLGGLEDVENGVRPSWLQPVPMGRGRVVASEAVWASRATLVVAVEARMALGDIARKAAEKVAQDLGCEVPVSGRNRDPATSIMNWRRDFSRKTPGSGKSGRSISLPPATGDCREILSEGRALIGECVTRGRDHKRIERLYTGALQQARALLAAQPRVAERHRA